MANELIIITFEVSCFIIENFIRQTQTNLKRFTTITEEGAKATKIKLHAECFGFGKYWYLFCCFDLSQTGMVDFKVVVIIEIVAIRILRTVGFEGMGWIVVELLN